MMSIRQKIDAYFDSKSPAVAVLCRELESLLHDTVPDLELAMKWSMPHYDHHGIMCGIGGFKAHATLFFHRGAQLPDPDSLFSGQEANKTNRTIKVTKAEDIDRSALTRYIQAAAALNAAAPTKKRAPKKPQPKPAADLEPPAEFLAALAANSATQAAWNACAPYKRKEYVQWIAKAKREATRDKRIAEGIPQIAQGIARSDKYRR
jgi:hypothetical protein